MNSKIEGLGKHRTTKAQLPSSREGEIESDADGFEQEGTEETEILTEGREVSEGGVVF